MLRTSARFVRLGLLFRPKADQLPTRRGRWMLVVFGAAAHERIVVRQPGRIGNAGNGIRQVIVSTGSIESLPARDTRRSRPTICETSRSCFGSMMRPLFSSGNRSR